MMTLLRKLLILLLFTGSLGFAHAQSVTHVAAIDIQRTGYDSLYTHLSWNTPRRAVSCTIKRETPSDTTFHVITNFQSGQDSIPRSTPPEYYAKFTIYFTGPHGEVYYDDGPGEIYGEIIVIEEDVFAMEIHDQHEDGIPEGYNWFEIAPKSSPGICFNISIHVAVDYVISAIRNTPGDDLDWNIVTYEFGVYLDIGANDDENVDIYTCDEFPYRKGREINLSTQPNFTLHPNPASQFFIIQPQEGFDPGNTKVRVMDPMGREVYRSSHRFAAGDEGLKVQMRDWKNGLYIVLLGEGKQQQAIRLIKN